MPPNGNASCLLLAHRLCLLPLHASCGRCLSVTSPQTHVDEQAIPTGQQTDTGYIRLTCGTRKTAHCCAADLARVPSTSITVAVNLPPSRPEEPSQRPESGDERPWRAMGSSTAMRCPGCRLSNLSAASSSSSAAGAAVWGCWFLSPSLRAAFSSLTIYMGTGATSELPLPELPQSGHWFTACRQNMFLVTTLLSELC